MQSTCPNCNSPVSPTARICENCGFTLTPEAAGLIFLRLMAGIILVLTFISFLVLIAYSNINYYLTSQGIITTPLFWRATSTMTVTQTLTLTRVPASTRTPSPTTTLTPTETHTTTPTLTFTPSTIPTNTETPSLTPSLTPIPSKTRPPSATPKPSATVKPASTTASTSASTAASTAVSLTTIPTATSASAASLTPTIGALSDPIQFLRAYYNMINNRIYQEAWSWLSADFISSRSKGLDHTFSYDLDYVPYWNTVASVEILQASTEFSTADYAQVLLQVRYNMLNGTNSVFNQRMFLVKGPADRPWLIDSADASN